MVLELKFGDSANGAICQIKNNVYPQVVREFTGDILLVGVNYDKKSKRHECRIERLTKTSGVDFRSDGKNLRSRREIFRSEKIDDIVGFCRVPRSLDEIAEHLGVSGKYYMKENYINPVLGTRLQMTEPDSLNSPTQKYIAIQ